MGYFERLELQRIREELERENFERWQERNPLEAEWLTENNKKQVEKIRIELQKKKEILERKKKKEEEEFDKIFLFFPVGLIPLWVFHHWYIAEEQQRPTTANGLALKDWWHPSLPHILVFLFYTFLLLGYISYFYEKNKKK